MRQDTNDPTRYKLAAKEYYALLQFFGMTSTFSVLEDILKLKLQKIPNGWRDYRMLNEVCAKLLDKILATIPGDKLAQIKNELGHTKCEIRVESPVVSTTKTMYTYIPEKVIDRIVEHAMSTECFMCEKRGAEARGCQLRKDLEACYHWDFPTVKNGECCHFSDNILEEIKRNDG